MADFVAPSAHPEILFPLGGNTSSPPDPLMPISERSKMSEMLQKALRRRRGLGGSDGVATILSARWCHVPISGIWLFGCIERHPPFLERNFFKGHHAFSFRNDIEIISVSSKYTLIYI
jgi:hypothetical protein